MVYIAHAQIVCTPSISGPKPLVIKDPELKALCKSVKATWRVWCQAGRPQNGTHYEAKQSTKKLVCKYVTSSHARRKSKNMTKCSEGLISDSSIHQGQPSVRSSL